MNQTFRSARNLSLQWRDTLRAITAAHTRFAPDRLSAYLPAATGEPPTDLTALLEQSTGSTARSFTTGSAGTGPRMTQGWPPIAARPLSLSHDVPYASDVPSGPTAVNEPAFQSAAPSGPLLTPESNSSPASSLARVTRLLDGLTSTSDSITPASEPSNSSAPAQLSPAIGDRSARASLGPSARSRSSRATPSSSSRSVGAAAPHLQLTLGSVDKRISEALVGQLQQIVAAIHLLQSHDRQQQSWADSLRLAMTG
jgi:hypothetical protein